MGDRWMMINFLKCDYLTQAGSSEASQQPNTSAISSEAGLDKNNQGPQHGLLLRVIAFENSTSS